MDRQQSYTVSTERGASDPLFTNIHHIEAQGASSRETTDDVENSLKLMPKALIVILSSTYCLITLCVLLILPIIELAIGVRYRDQCTINSNIPQYLIVAGACSLISVVLTIAIVVACICLFKGKSTARSVAAVCIVSIISIIILLLSIFLSCWFIAGNVWIFGAKKNVVYDDITSPNYCHRTLYDFAFIILILNYVMAVLSCISSCVRSCVRACKSD